MRRDLVWSRRPVGVDPRVRDPRDRNGEGGARSVGFGLPAGSTEPTFKEGNRK
jgi:hypothetical protein